MAAPLYGFAYSERALAFLQGLTPKLRRQIINKIEALASAPIPPGSKIVKGMKEGEEQVRRIRSGDNRALYIVQENQTCVVILDIGHRKDVYR